MHDEVSTTVRDAIDGLYPSLDDVAPDWERVVADASPRRRRSEPAPPQRLRRSRRYLVRGALVGGAAAAVALGAVSALPGDGLLPGEDPSAVARAAAALVPPADTTILHTVVVTTQTRPDGAATVSRTETWLQASPPYAARQLAGGRELAQVDGALQYYDPRTNTIHTTPPDVGPPTRFTLDADGLRDRMLTLLRSGRAREDGQVSIDGRNAVRIVSADGSITLIVDAATSEPIEWSLLSEEGIRETSRFETYEWLPATKANLALLSLSAQHPGAAIRQDATVTGTEGEGK